MTNETDNYFDPCMQPNFDDFNIEALTEKSMPSTTEDDLFNSMSSRIGVEPTLSYKENETCKFEMPKFKLNRKIANAKHTKENVKIDNLNKMTFENEDEFFKYTSYLMENGNPITYGYNTISAKIKRTIKNNLDFPEKLENIISFIKINKKIDGAKHAKKQEFSLSNFKLVKGFKEKFSVTFNKMVAKTIKGKITKRKAHAPIKLIVTGKVIKRPANTYKIAPIIKEHFCEKPKTLKRVHRAS